MLAQTLLFFTFYGFALSRPAADVDSVDKYPPPWGGAKVAAAWYAGWHEAEFTLDKVSWSKYTHMTYAFAETKPSLTGVDESGLTGLPAFVKEARKNRVKALVSVGGWTGSTGFSFNVATPVNRTAFVKTMVDLTTKYKLDGLDFDWEYPTGLGVGCNAVDPKDTANFLAFLQELRRHRVGRKLILTAAVGITPFPDENGDPITDASGFSKVLDYIAIMNYDIWGPWSDTVGPNAPLDDSCAPEAARVGSANTAIKTWRDARVPANKLVLGVPSYGHSFRVRKQDAYVSGSTTQLALYPPFDKDDPPAGDKWDDAPGGADVCGVVSTAPGGTVNYWGLVDLGYLDVNEKPKDGHPFIYDQCTQTAYSYNPETETMVSYDNPETMLAKGKFIKSNKLRGFATWEAGGDYKDSLLNAIRKGAGLDRHDSGPSSYFPPGHHGVKSHRGSRKPFGRRKLF